jgi:hypothetical protein
MNKLIIGAGLPRSGTGSLQVLLHHCTGADIYHEAHALPFDASDYKVDEVLQEVREDREGRYIGNVAFFWLPHLRFLREETDAKIVGVFREDAEEHLESCMAIISDSRIQSSESPAFPNMDCEIEECWRRYRNWGAEQLEKFDVPTFETTNLDTEETQSEILDVAGIPEEDRQYHPNLHYHERKS